MHSDTAKKIVWKLYFDVIWKQPHEFEKRDDNDDDEKKDGAPTLALCFSIIFTIALSKFVFLSFYWHTYTYRAHISLEMEKMLV